jgi:hypothetical protein
MRRAAQSAGVAVLGVLRRIRYASPPAAVAASVTAATIGGAIVIGGDPLSMPPASGAVPAMAGTGTRIAPLVTIPDADPVGMATGTVRSTRTATTVRTVAAPDRPKPPKPPKPGDIATPPIGDPRGPVHTREGVTVEDEHESFEESLERCIAEALTIDPQHPVCDPEKEQ